MRATAAAGVAAGLVLAAASGAVAGVTAFTASGPGLMVVGPDPYDLNKTRSIAGSLSISGPGLPAPVRTVSAVADVTVGPVRYRLVAAGLHTRWGRPTQRAIPSISPRLVAWGLGQLYRNGAHITAAAPVVITLLSDAPLRGVSLEVATTERSLPAVPHGYLHVMWWDGDWPAAQASARP